MKNTEQTDGFPCPYGKYQLLARIGAGGMAEIFRARLPGVAGFEKILVIKRLLPHLAQHPAMVKMFINEAKLAAEVQHRNVVQVFELGQLDHGELYIAMEHVAGTDLRQVLRAAAVNSMRIPPWFAVHVVMEVLEGLAHAHALRHDDGRSRNVVHRDVTPGNIFLSQLGDVKLGDFGVAHDESRADKTRAGQLKGKVPYMSPEQLYGRELDARTDVFAMGVVLWECLTQRRLFGGRPDMEAMNLICFGDRKPPSMFAADVPEALDWITLRALSASPNERIASAAEMHDELAQILPQLRARVNAKDVKSVIDVLLGNKEPSTTTGPNLIDDASIVKQNFLDSTPGGSRPVPKIDELELTEVLEPEPLEIDFDSVIAETVAEVSELVPQVSSRSDSSSSLIAGLDNTRHASRVSDLARGIWKDHLRLDGDYDGPHPFWVRAHEGTIVGPLSHVEMMLVLSYEARAGFIDRVAVSATQQRWIGASTFATLTGQEMLLDPFADKERELPRVAFAGSFERTSMASIFGRIAREKPTGRLIVVNPTFGQFSRRELILNEGRPTFAYGNTPQLQLPAMLIAKNLLAKEQLGEMLHAVALENRPLDQIVDKKVGVDTARYQAVIMRERMLDLFKWTVGRYALEPLRAAGAPVVSSTLALLPEMILRTKTADDLRVALAPYMGSKLERSERFARGIAELRLSAAQNEAVLPFGGRTLAASLRMASCDERTALALAYILIETELLLRPL